MAGVRAGRCAVLLALRAHQFRGTPRAAVSGEWLGRAASWPAADAVRGQPTPSPSETEDLHETIETARPHGHGTSMTLMKMICCLLKSALMRPQSLSAL